MTVTDVDGMNGNDDSTNTAGVLVHPVGLLFGFLGVGAMYFIGQHEFTRANAANALNWHIPVSILAIAVVVVGLTLNEMAGVYLAVGLVVLTIVFALVATIRAYQGFAWKYPIVPDLV